jgi:hypothetical protein
MVKVIGEQIYFIQSFLLLDHETKGILLEEHLVSSIKRLSLDKNISFSI